MLFEVTYIDYAECSQRVDTVRVDPILCNTLYDGFIDATMIAFKNVDAGYTVVKIEFIGN